MVLIYTKNCTKSPEIKKSRSKIKTSTRCEKIPV